MSTRLRTVVLIVAATFVVANACPALAAGPPAGLPGPPPEASSGLPLPPGPGQAPPPQPPGPPSAIGAGASMPGLLSGTASLGRAGFKLRVACRTGGKAAFSVPSFGGSTLASARYKCAKGRATASFVLTKSVVGRIGRSGSVLGRVSFTQGAAKTRASVMVGPRPPAPVFWTSVFGLLCGAPGSNQAQLQAPNFTVTPPTTIDVRPWLAWYSPATGWQWQGTAGPGASRWYRFTATPSGVAEWRTPLGTIDPWLWSPIAVTPGRGTYVIAVFEAVYWYSHPAYVWRFVHSVPGAGTAGDYCAYG
jgi:hypothetical protein